MTGLSTRLVAMQVVVLLGACGHATAQDRTSQPPAPPAGTEAPLRSDTDYAPPPPAQPSPIPATGFVMPDVPDDWNRRTTYSSRLFSARLSLVPIIDYSSFIQDGDSVRQVGEQQNQWDVRTFRVMSSGQIETVWPISYLISVEVKGRDHVQAGSSQVGFTDWFFGTSLGRFGTVKYGKVKEPFVYEMVGDAANLQQQERILSPFFVSRGTGVRWANSVAHDRVTLSAGWFNSWWVEDIPFKTHGNDLVGRVTALPAWAADGANYIEIGMSARHAGATSGTLQFRGRPEANTTSYYVDSGNLPSEDARELAVEALVGHGPFMLSTEYAHAHVDSNDTGDPQFWGAYVTVSYVLTGEHRPYDRKAGYARRVLPQGRWGAWEIFGRYSHVDLTDRRVEGGVMDKGALGLNWWATRRWKIGFDYGLTDLDRFNAHGLTHAFHTRFQWVY